MADPDRDDAGRHDAVIDASGSLAAIDQAIGRLNRGGDLVLAGFYGERIGCAFAPAFMREVSLLISAEFRPDDISAVLDLVSDGRLDLSGLITHRNPPSRAAHAYETAFSDPDCLKMVIDWRNAA